jgi:hypothetical protein
MKLHKGWRPGLAELSATGQFGALPGTDGSRVPGCSRGLAIRQPINLYWRVFPNPTLARPVPRGRFAQDRVSLHGPNHLIAKANLCSPLPLSAGPKDTVLLPRDKTPWKSSQPTPHPLHGCQSGRFAGTADPRLGKLALRGPLMRGS